MNYKTLRGHALGLLTLLGLQFLAGMTLNLFINLAAARPGTSGGNYFIRDWHSLVWALSGSGGAALAIHAYLALAIVLGCLALLIRGLKLHDKIWAWAGGVAALFTIGALFNGLSFLDYNQDFSSMIMASAWLIAVGSLIVGLNQSSPHGKNPKSLKNL
ncbi:MAG: hypothetical protein ACREGA_03640 [Candidatus Saccharimonadales bacterium]